MRPSSGLIGTRPSRNRSLVVQQSILHTARAAKLAENRSPHLWREADMSPALGAPTAQRRQTTLRFEGRLGVSGLAPPEFGSPTGGLSPCHGSQALCRPERRLRGLPAIGPLASANRSPWLQELIRHYTRIYCCFVLKVAPGPAGILAYSVIV